MKVLTHSKIIHNGMMYWFLRTAAGYDEYVDCTGERIFVDDTGHITHSTIADIIAWSDDKTWSQGQ